MAAIFNGCQGKPEPKPMEKKCPHCGHEIEIWTIDTDAECPNCGFKIYNDTLNCVQWCQYAKQCVGEAMYEQMMKIAENQKHQKDPAISKKDSDYNDITKIA